MRPTLAVAALLPALALGGATDKNPLAGYTLAGKPQSCMPLTGVSSGGGLLIAGDQLITFQETPRRLWVTHPITTCVHMDPYDTLVVDRFGGQTCRGDRFRVLRPGLSILSPDCIFGDFTLYEKVPAAKAP